jgi:hypothetical protein
VCQLGLALGFAGGAVGNKAGMSLRPERQNLSPHAYFQKPVVEQILFALKKLK